MKENTEKYRREIIMKKKIVNMLIMTSAVAMLAACTDNGGESRGQYTEPEDVTVAPDKPADPTPTEAEPEHEPVSAGPAHIFDEEFKNGEVEGQGTQFVRVGRKVYYRVIAPEGWPDTAIFGEYLYNEKMDVPSSLWVYDLDDNSYEKVMDIEGWGNMYAGVQGLFISDGKNEISVIDPVNKTQTPYVEGRLITDVSDDGTLLMTTNYDSNYHQHGQICRDGEYICYTAEENNSIVFYGLAGDDMIALYHESRSDEYEMVSYQNSIMTSLGTLTLPGDMMSPYPELIEYKAEGDQAYITVGYYEGSGHFLARWDAYSMTAGEEDSLVLLDKEDRDFTSDFTSDETEPRMLIDNGDVYFYDVASNSLGLSEKFYGDLVYYDSPFGASVVKRYLVDELAGETEWDDQLLQAVVLDNTAFVITATGHHIPSDDIGWRYSYAPIMVEYMAIPFGPDVEKDKNGVPVNYEFLTTIDVNHLDKEEADELTGTDWDLYSYEVEGNYELAYSDTYQKHLRFEENGDITLTETDTSTNKTETFTLVREDDGDYDPAYITYKLDRKNGSPENWVMIYLIGDHLEFSVDWQYSDGTYGGCNYVFHPEFNG